MKKIALLFFALLLVISSFSQSQNRNPIIIPDIPGYISLKCDFHMHTVFSDGRVWPDVRVEEAYFEGLDAIAITDHIEYRPHKADITSVDHNRSFELAQSAAKKMGIILIHASEITRGMPPGHLNALFVQDANLLDTIEYLDALREAKNQGAFIFWNHPGWFPQAKDGIKWYEEHTKLLNAGLINGIEIVNSNEWYPEAFKWCIEKNLTLLSDSDIHESLASFNEKYELEIRPMTIVFAKERTMEGIKEALFAGRTVAWFQNKVIGKEEFLASLAKESLDLEPAHHQDKSSEYRKLINRSDFHFYFELNGKEFHLKPGGEMIVKGSIENPVYNLKIKNFITENAELNINL